MPNQIKAQEPSADLWKSVNAFLRWLQNEGYESYDPYDVWGTSYGLFARRLYYRRPRVALPLIAPVLLMEILLPQCRRLFVMKQRFATADAQLLLAFLNLYEITGEARLLQKAKDMAADLRSYSVPGYKGLCWGYPFDWQMVGGLYPKNTPFITTTPYCFEAFLRLFDFTGEAEYLEAARSVAQFVAYDLKDHPIGDNAAAASYSPMDEGHVVNASAYRAMVLFEAARRFDCPAHAQTAAGNLRFILQSQQADGSWLYSASNPTESFIDHFHTCFVLKNLFKLNLQLRDTAIKTSIERGYAFYRRDLFENGLPKSFARKPRAQITRLEMYNFAEAITLGALLGPDIPESRTMAEELAAVLCSQYQCGKGHFVTRVYTGGWRHTFPFMRWPQAQLFYALTNLMKAQKQERPPSSTAQRGAQPSGDMPVLPIVGKNASGKCLTS